MQGMVTLKVYTCNYKISENTKTPMDLYIRNNHTNYMRKDF
jgi:hypothetical protein